MPDPHDLQRFVEAQDHAGAYERAMDELRRGRKRSHWMWFVFPQLSGLGFSEMARRYGISGLAEARAYLEHDVLGRRLREATDALLDRGLGDGPSAEAILGQVDAQKLRSSMTLFLRAAPQERRWAQVLERYFDGVADTATDRLLSA